MWPPIAALPTLFQPVTFADGHTYIDGGWADPHGITALRPGELAVVHRLYGLPPDDTLNEESLLQRPPPLEEASHDAAHYTVAIDNPERLAKWQVFWQLDWHKDKLRRLITIHEACALSWWLSAPDRSASIAVAYAE